MKKIVKTSIGILILLGSLFAVVRIHQVQAASPIVVNSTEDNQTASDGLCTLREAINNANSSDGSDTTDGDCASGTAGADTIEFNLSGVSDFTNNGQAGYRIQLASSLPAITEPLIINGFSQDGSSPNTKVSPAPMDTVLLVDIDGTSYDGLATVLDFNPGSDNSVIKGLVLNNFAGVAVFDLHADGIKIQGNYIGTDPTGLSAESNGVGMTTSGTRGLNATIGGLNPAERNVIAGNSAAGTGSSGAYPASGWTIQGNYIGVGANGTTAIPNSVAHGPGGFSIDEATNVTVGGSETGAANVIAGNNDQGLAPDHADGLRVEGNYIGTDYTGIAALGNVGPGINLNNSEGVVIKNNVISGNGGDGFYGDHNTNLTFQGNKFGTDVLGTTSLSNGGSGIIFGEATTDVLIGGTGAGEGNVIAYNGAAISTSSSGIDVTAADDANISIIGNSIFSNEHLGIDLGFFDLVTINDANDSDAGANDLLNYPENITYLEEAGSTKYNYDLDVPAGSYRIEFFSNTAADDSGNGEGETLIGHQDITSAGNGSQSYKFTISGTGFSNVSATATLIDESTPSNFGPTSEFSAIATERDAVADISISKTLDNPEDVTPGATISYTVTLTNNGPDSIDLNNYTTPLVADLFLDIYPGDLSFSSTPTAGVTCVNGGNAAAALGEGPFANHLDYGGLACDYTAGSSHMLTAGQSFSVVIEFTVNQNSDLQFTNYAVHAATSTDPDYGLVGAAFSSGSDVIDGLLAANVNNIAGATYPISVAPSDDGSNSGQNSGGTSNPLIPNTGAGGITLIKSVFSLLSGMSLVAVSLGQTRKHKKWHV